MSDFSTMLSYSIDTQPTGTAALSGATAQIRWNSFQEYFLNEDNEGGGINWLLSNRRGKEVLQGQFYAQAPSDTGTLFLAILKSPTAATSSVPWIPGMHGFPQCTLQSTLQRKVNLILDTFGQDAPDPSLLGQLALAHLTEFDAELASRQQVLDSMSDADRTQFLDVIRGVAAAPSLTAVANRLPDELRFQVKQAFRLK